MGKKPKSHKKTEKATAKRVELSQANAQNDAINENESLNQEVTSIINNETSIPASPNPSSVNQTASRSEDSKLDTIDKSSQNASINKEEEGNSMDIDENQQELELVIPQAQIEPVPEESMSQSISPRLSRIPRFNRNSSSLTSPPSTSTIRLNSTASRVLSETKIPSPPYHRKRDRFSSNLSPPTTVPPTNLNLLPPATIPPPFVSNLVFMNQDIQLNIERMDLNERASNQTRRVASINASTNVTSNNSNTRPAISVSTFSYPSRSYGQHQKNNSEDEGGYADLKKTKALMTAIDLTLRQYIFTDLEIYT